MPNRKECYKDMQKFQKTRNAQRKRYYHKTAVYERNYWTPEHDKMILDHNLTDAELSTIVGHSVSAIQSRRHRLKHNDN